MRNTRREQPKKNEIVALAALPGALTVATLAGGIWSLIEAWHLQVPDGAFLQAWAPTGAAALSVVLLSLPLGWCVGTLWRWEKGGGRIRNVAQADPIGFASRLGAGLLALVLLSYLVFGGAAVFTALFSSEQVRHIALALIIPFIAIFGWGVLRGGEWGLRRGLTALVGRIGDDRRPGKSLPIWAFVCALVLTIGWGISFIFLAPKVFEELNILPVLPLGVIGAAAVAGSLLPARRPVWVAALLGVLGLGTMALVYMRAETPDALKVRLHQYAPGTSFILGFKKSEPVRIAAKIKSNSKSATCKPGQTPPDARRVGRVGEEAPDIILLTVDAMRWDHTSLGGYKRDTTPNLKARAESAAVFANAYSTASSTRQSFRSMFSGIYSSRIAAPKSSKWGVSFAPGQETIASYLRAAGYQTIALSTDPGAFPEKYGAFRGFELIDESPVERGNKTHRGAPYMVNRIIGELSDPDRDEPTFIWTHMLEAHQPYFGGPNPVKYGKREVDRYDRSLHFVDTQIERLLEFAQGPGLSRPVIVILAADHGQAFREHGYRAHGATIYGEETHIPLIFWGPMVKPGTYKTPVSMIDLVPTTLDLLGLKVPEALCGESLRPSLEGGQEPPARPVYMEVIPDRTRDYFGVGLIQGDDKLVLRPTQKVIQLFDLAKDPGEKSDRSDKSAARRDEMIEWLREFYLEHGLEPSDYGI